MLEKKYTDWPAKSKNKIGLWLVFFRTNAVKIIEIKKSITKIIGDRNPKSA